MKLVGFCSWKSPEGEGQERRCFDYLKALKAAKRTGRCA
jgi:hypothetical protein